LIASNKMDDESYIVFIDEAGFMMGPLVRRTWAPRGKTPVLRVTTPHERISAIGAITLRRSPVQFGFHFHLLPLNMNFCGYSVVAFLAHLRARLHGPMTVLWDEIRIHSSFPVREFLSAHPDVEVVQFPPYAPELNPVDYVWSYVKYCRLSNYCPLDPVELRESIVRELSRVKRSARLLRSFFSATGLSLDGLE
jgi:transposase